MHMEIQNPILLKNAYANAKEQIERGIKVWPTVFAPIWENIVTMAENGIDIYDACYYGAKKYAVVEKIDIDAAFSSIVCTFGVTHKSMVWHEIMSAYHAKEPACRNGRGMTMDMNLTPNAASPEYVQDMAKVMNMTDDQRVLACDLGYYNEIIRGYLIRAMEFAGFDAKDIDRALSGLHDTFDCLSAAEARVVYQRYGNGE